MARSRMKELRLQPGATVLFGERVHILTKVISMTEVLIRHAETHQESVVPLSQLKVFAPASSKPKADLLATSGEQWQIAEKRHALIRSLLDKPDRVRQDVELEARKSGFSASTFYRWLALYEESGLLSALLPNPRSDKNRSRLDQKIETIIARVIEEEFLTNQKKPKRDVYNSIRKQCLSEKITPPHKSTIYRRIQSLPAKTVLSKRQGQKVASQQFSPIRGSFPGADFPLAVFQIDHTLLDIILVDDQHRMPIGRPWITLAIDVFSRMVAGFYISFHCCPAKQPSVTS